LLKMLINVDDGSCTALLGCYTIMSDYDQDRDDELMAIPRLAEQVGVTPRVLRYWEEQQLISPTREHGKLRYSPRDRAIAALIRRLIDAGVGIEGIKVLKRLAERDVRRAAAAGRRCASCTSARPSGRKPAPTRSTTHSTSRRPRHRPTYGTGRHTGPRLRPGTRKRSSVPSCSSWTRSHP
jgi:DNA-binding transcriptional MerR regulator